MDNDTFPETTVFEFVPLAEVRSPILRIGIDHWNALRGSRRFPARSELRPRAIAGAMANMVLIKVLDGGADFEFGIVGDAATRSFSVPRQGRKLSEIAVEEPYQATRLASLYRCCVEQRAPIAVHSVMGHDAKAANFTHLEAVVLPLGPDDDTVDHLLGFGIYQKQLSGYKP